MEETALHRTSLGVEISQPDWHGHTVLGSQVASDVHIEVSTHVGKFQIEESLPP